MWYQCSLIYCLLMAKDIETYSFTTVLLHPLFLANLNCCTTQRRLCLRQQGLQELKEPLLDVYTFVDSFVDASVWNYWNYLTHFFFLTLPELFIPID